MTEPDVRRIGADPDDLDPDLRPPGDSEAPATQLENLLGDLESALTAQVDHEPLTLRVEKRPGVSVRYRTEITDEQMAAWRKRAADKKAPGGINTLRFCSIVVANQCEAILMHGKEVYDDDGGVLHFGHQRIKALYGLQKADRASDVVRKLFGADPHVMLHANEVMDRAGFGDQVVEVEGEDTPTAGF